MFCKKCGQKVSPDSGHCGNCGAVVGPDEYCGGFWGLVDEVPKINVRSDVQRKRHDVPISEQSNRSAATGKPDRVRSSPVLPIALCLGVLLLIASVAQIGLGLRIHSALSNDQSDLPYVEDRLEEIGEQLERITNDVQEIKDDRDATHASGAADITEQITSGYDEMQACIEMVNRNIDSLRDEVYQLKGILDPGGEEGEPSAEVPPVYPEMDRGSADEDETAGEEIGDRFPHVDTTPEGGE